MNVIIGSTEGTVKKGMEINLENVLNKIRNDYGGNIESWWDTEFLDLQMDMEIIEEGNYSENLEFFIEDEMGVSHNAYEYLESHI
jgi:hypothetical protein